MIPSCPRGWTFSLLLVCSIVHNFIGLSHQTCCNKVASERFGELFEWISQFLSLSSACRVVFITFSLSTSSTMPVAYWSLCRINDESQQLLLFTTSTNRRFWTSFPPFILKHCGDAICIDLCAKKRQQQQQSSIESTKEYKPLAVCMGVYKTTHHAHHGEHIIPTVFFFIFLTQAGFNLHRAAAGK